MPRGRPPKVKPLPEVAITEDYVKSEEVDGWIDQVKENVRGRGRPRKPRPKILSLEDVKEEDLDISEDAMPPDFHISSDVEESNPEPGEKAGLIVEKPSKRGRPQKGQSNESATEKKRAGGRKKDTTRSNVTCEFCGKFFRFRATLKQHEQIHYGIKEFECEVCHKRFLHKGTLKVHLRLHTGEMPYKCPHCPKQFRGQTALDCHVFRHTKQGTKCPQCPSIFATPSIVKQHIREVHTTERLHTCQICGVTYKHRKSLRLHLRNHQKRVCPDCGKVFHSIYAMMSHRKIHAEDHFQFKCGFCDRKFKKEDELQAHNKLRGRAFQCDICCHSFNKVDYLANHNRRNHWKEMGLEQLKVAAPKNGWNRKGVKKPRKGSELEAIAGEGDVDPPMQTVESADVTCSDSVAVQAEPWNGHSENANLSYSVHNPPQQLQQANETVIHPLVTISQTTVHQIQCIQSEIPLVVPTYQPEQVVKIITTEIEQFGPQYAAKPETNLEVKDNALPNPEGSDIEQSFEKLEEHDSDSNYDYGGEHIQIEDDLEDLEELQEKQTEQKGCEEVKDEPMKVEEDVTPTEEQQEIFKVEILEPDEMVDLVHETEEVLIDSIVPFVEKKEESSDSDDDVPLAALVPKRRTRGRPPGSAKTAVPGRRKTKSVLRDLPEKEITLKEEEDISALDIKEENVDLKNELNADGTDDDDKAYIPRADSRSDGSEAIDGVPPGEEQKPLKRRKRKTRTETGKGTRKPSREMFCPYCEYSFKGRIALARHKATAHPEMKGNTGPFICELCGKSYATAGSMLVHRGVHKEYQRFKCDECPKAFSYRCYLENHKRAEHLHERLICPLCGKQFKYSQDLKVHNKQHEDDKPFKCDQCPSVFRYPSALRCHKALHVETVFTCNICNKDFRYANSLRVHKRLHTGVKRFRCEICDREFHTKAPLMRHLTTHSVEREMKCVACDKVFYKKIELVIHQSKEHPNNPVIGRTIKIHTCPVCGQEFTKLSNLKSHSYIHGDVYKYKCDRCEDQKFKQHAGLRHHLIHFHKLELQKRKRKVDEKPKTSATAVVCSTTDATLTPAVSVVHNGVQFMVQQIECE